MIRYYNGLPALALNEQFPDGVPVVIENPDGYPFDGDELKEDWHVASDEEIAAYRADYADDDYPTTVEEGSR